MRFSESHLRTSLITGNHLTQVGKTLIGLKREPEEGRSDVFLHFHGLDVDFHPSVDVLYCLLHTQHVKDLPTDPHLSSDRGERGDLLISVSLSGLTADLTYLVGPILCTSLK